MLRCLLALALALALAVTPTGCTGDSASTSTPAPTPAKAEAEPKARPDAKSEPLPAPVTRKKGAVDGAFTPEVTHLVAGAPFIVHFSVQNGGTEPLTFTIGGDNYSQGPLRFAWLVRNAGGEVVCDLRGRPEPMAGAGAQVDKTFAPGESHERYLAPQTGCPALMQPGRYLLRVARVLVRDRDAEACQPILPPDTTVEPLDDRGVPLEEPCKSWLLAAPAIATDMTLDVAPYDPAAVRDAVVEALAKETNEQRDHALSSYAAWLCLTAGCEVAWGKPVRDWLPDAAKALPAAWPASR